MVVGWFGGLVVVVDGVENRGEQENEDDAKRGQAVAAAGFVDGMPDGVVEISVQRMVAEELDLDGGGAEERPQDPRELRAEKPVAAEPGEPGEQGGGGGGRSGGLDREQAVEVEIRGDAGESDERGVRDEVGGVRVFRPRRVGRRGVPRQEKRNRRERAEDQGGQRERGEQGEQRLAEAEAGAEQQAEKSV
jgi:hypothetical protein